MDFIFDPSLALYLPLYRLDGASIKSQDAYGHLCTVTGALWRPNGRYFDGSDDLISCGNNAVLNIPNSFTLEAWVRNNEVTPTVDHQAILFKTNATLSQSEYCLILTADGYARVAIFQANGLGYGSATGSSDLTDDRWHHLAAVFTSPDVIGTRLELFVDSISVAVTTSFTGTRMTTGTGTLRLGIGEYTPWKYKGYIGEVRVYNRALSCPEIQWDYLATKWRYR